MNAQNLPKVGSIGSSDLINRGGGEPSEQTSNMGSVTGGPQSQGGAEQDDFGTLQQKFKALRRENQQLRNLLR